MAKSNRRTVSSAPSNQEKGGSFGIPAGAICTITELVATTWEDAGEKALKGNRQADDPCLRLTVEIDGQDDPVVQHLSCGKGNRLQPTDDGEHFQPASEDIQIDGLPASSNTGVFLASVFEKKRHGKKTPDEGILVDGFSQLVGLKFRAGKEKISREGLEGDGGRPTLVCAEIIEEPTGPGGGKRKSAPVKSKRRSDEDEEDDQPRRKRGRKDEEEEEDEEDDKDEDEDEEEDEDEDEDDEAEETPRGKAAGAGKKSTGAAQAAGTGTSGSRKTKKQDLDLSSHAEQAEKAIAECLDLPKYRKGIPLEKAFSAVFTHLRDRPDAKRVAGVVDFANGGEDWLKDADRPWEVKEKKIDGEEVEVIVGV